MIHPLCRTHNNCLVQSWTTPIIAHNYSKYVLSDKNSSGALHVRLARCCFQLFFHAEQKTLNHNFVFQCNAVSYRQTTVSKKAGFCGAPKFGRLSTCCLKTGIPGMPSDNNRMSQAALPVRQQRYLHEHCAGNTHIHTFLFVINKCQLHGDSQIWHIGSPDVTSLFVKAVSFWLMIFPTLNQQGDRNTWSWPSLRYLLKIIIKSWLFFLIANYYEL